MWKKMTTTAACVAVASLTMASGAIGAGGGKLARGHTGQGRSIRVRVFPERIEVLGFSIELRCGGGYALVDLESNFLPSPVSRKGRIHDAQVGDTDEILIRGHLRGDQVSGRVRVRDRLGKYRCSSPWVSFKAHA